MNVIQTTNSLAGSIIQGMGGFSLRGIKGGVLSAFLFCSLLFVCCSGKQTTISCFDLRCENLTDPLAIDNTQPHLSWKMKVPGNEMQHAYRIIVSSDSVALHNDSGDLWDSGIVESSLSVMIPYQGVALQSPSLAYWKVSLILTHSLTYHSFIHSLTKTHSPTNSLTPTQPLTH